MIQGIQIMIQENTVNQSEAFQAIDLPPSAGEKAYRGYDFNPELWLNRETLLRLDCLGGWQLQRHPLQRLGDDVVLGNNHGTVMAHVAGVWRMLHLVEFEVSQHHPWHVSSFLQRNSVRRMPPR